MHPVINRVRLKEPVDEEVWGASHCELPDADTSSPSFRAFCRDVE
jgi:hypothetical protein